MKIMIVDDELISRMTLKRLMESFDKYESDAFESGEEALESIRDDNLPDLILLDILMKGMDGYQVCESLKARLVTKDIPVIFLSANAEIEDKTRGFEVGAVDYITKPFHKAEVKARVQTHLSIKKMREDLYAKNVTLEAQVDEIQKKTEQLREKDVQLLEMDRIAGIGALAAGIAHEINNPLGFIKSSIGSMKKGIEKIINSVSYWNDKPVEQSLMEEHKKYLTEIGFDNIIKSMNSRFDRINRGIERIMKIVNSLRSFSRVDMEIVGDIDINKSIEEVVDILQPQDNSDVVFVKDLEEVPTIKCNSNEINQCFLHVVKNALDAVEQKGTINIKSSWNEQNGQIVIMVIDDGKGMSQDVMRQALNPFFTTKSVGSGTGVGLSLTENIIKRHGGMIGLQSKEGSGTTVTISLPPDYNGPTNV